MRMLHKTSALDNPEYPPLGVPSFFLRTSKILPSGLRDPIRPTSKVFSNIITIRQKSLTGS